MSATRVPVAGGSLNIYGHKFGSDASTISVTIRDPNNAEPSFECSDVRMVTPDRVIACTVAAEGTGKGKHIQISVTSTTDEGTTTLTNTDANTAFNREAPELVSLTYTVEAKTITLGGTNFGNDASKVSVQLQDSDHPVLSVENSHITLRLLRNRREGPDQYVIPTTRFAYVTVDGQSSIANMSVVAGVFVAAPPTRTGDENLEAVTAGNNKKTEGVDKGTVAGIIVGGAFAFVIVSVFVAVFVLRRRSKEAIEQQHAKSFAKGDSEDKGLDVASIVLGERAPSIAESQVISSPLIMHMRDSTTPINMELDLDSVGEKKDKDVAQDVKDLVRANTATSCRSLEEIDLREEGGLYEKNEERVADTDSSFSESSEEDVDSDAGDDAINGHESSFDAEFSDASPAHTPLTGRPNVLQISAEYPVGGNFGTTGTTPPPTPPTPSYYSPALGANPPSPSAPVLTGSGRARLPQSLLRRSLVVAPPLSLDGDSSDESPLPSPRHSHAPLNSSVGSAGSRGGKRGGKVSTRGMRSVPSSRISTAATKFALTKQQTDPLDSPQL